MGLFSMLKKNAKLALKGNYGRAILILLLIFGVTILITILEQIAFTVFIKGPSLYEIIEEFVDDPAYALPELLDYYKIESIIVGITSVISLLFVTPLSLGAMRWFFRLVHGERMQIVELFHYFETLRGFGRSLWYNVNIYVRCLLWSIPFFTVPSAILGISVYFLSGGEEISRSSSAIASTGIFLASVLMLLASAFYAACISRYALVPYLIAENDDLTVRKAIRESVRYTRGFRFSIFWFELSFIGWMLLSIFVWPLLLYVMPYYYTAFAMYARYIIEKNRYCEPNETKEFAVAPDGAPPVFSVPADTLQVPETQKIDTPQEYGLPEPEKEDEDKSE